MAPTGAAAGPQRQYSWPPEAISGGPQGSKYSPDWGARGVYRLAVTELGEDRAAELLHDLRRLARNPRRYRNGADGKPRYRVGRTVSDQHRRQQSIR